MQGVVWWAWRNKIVVLVIVLEVIAAAQLLVDLYLLAGFYAVVALAIHVALGSPNAWLRPYLG